MATESIEVFAPAKINWHLTVERRRDDGYHEIHTVFQAIEWGDRLVCRINDLLKCQVTCDDPGVPTDERNLIVKAWQRLAQAFPGKVHGLSVNLNKQIPMQAGLGGGSSDGAATLVAINRLFGLGLTASELEGHAAALGSDCALFIRGGTALGTGRGEVLRPLVNHLPAVWLVVVHPGFPSATVEAYRRIRPADWEDGAMAQTVAAAIERGDLADLKKLIKNVFNYLVIENDLRYKVLLERLQGEGIVNYSLSGSGSAVFGFADGEGHAWEACRRLKDFYPTVMAVRLRGEGIGIH